ncbi:MAG: hypothetical protein HY821_22345 [Acidobacteria bacterium]|nr:hypothetical protein [Acidobacteriota bacterium]
MSCGYQMGLLILRPCGEPVAGQCGSCGVGLCAAHLGAGECPSCMVMRGERNENDLTREAGARKDYYESYGEGAHFGDPAYFNAADRAALRPGVAGFAMGADDDNDYDPFET